MPDRQDRTAARGRTMMYLLGVGVPAFLGGTYSAETPDAAEWDARAWAHAAAGGALGAIGTGLIDLHRAGRARRREKQA